MAFNARQISDDVFIEKRGPHDFKIYRYSTTYQMLMLADGKFAFTERGAYRKAHRWQTRIDKKRLRDAEAAEWNSGRDNKDEIPL